MGGKKKVIPTEPAFVDDDDDGSDGIENGGVDPEEEDSGRGLLIAVNKHVVNEDEDDDDEGEEEEDSEVPKQRKEPLKEKRIPAGCVGLLRQREYTRNARLHKIIFPRDIRNEQFDDM